MDIAPSSKTDFASRTALQGLSTPLSNITIASNPSEPLLAIVSTQQGTLTADIAPGATVHGNGSPMLWLSGSIAQINAKLATLAYNNDTAGADHLSITLLDASGLITTSLQAPITVLSLAGADRTDAVVSIDHGTITLDTRVLDGPSIALAETMASENATTCLLINTTIGARSVLSIRNENAIGAVMPRLAIAGRVELDGATSFGGNGTTVTLAQHAVLLNEGSMAIGVEAAQFTGAGTLVNDGVIAITGDGTAHAPIRIDTAIAGNGQIVLRAGASLSLAAATAATETVRFGPGANTLDLAAPATFAGTIAGFASGDRLVLDGISASFATYNAAADATTGILTLFDGQHIVTQLRFSAPQASTIFQFGADAAGSIVIRLAADAATSRNVYRFFDATTGTQMLTSNRAERDAIIGNRPDLRYEGVGFQAIDPAQTDADTVSIFRFFDTGNGTHFLTASVTERDTLIGTRSDLVYEPASTLYEHATAQSGDRAVYRFFDQNSGAHFFTASVAERAILLSTRPDLAVEGVAFYAPT